MVGQGQGFWVGPPISGGLVLPTLGVVERASFLNLDRQAWIVEEELLIQGLQGLIYTKVGSSLVRG